MSGEAALLGPFWAVSFGTMHTFAHPTTHGLAGTCLKTHLPLPSPLSVPPQAAGAAAALLQGLPGLPAALHPALWAAGQAVVERCRARLPGQPQQQLHEGALARSSSCAAVHAWLVMHGVCV